MNKIKKIITGITISLVLIGMPINAGTIKSDNSIDFNKKIKVDDYNVIYSFDYSENDNKIELKDESIFKELSIESILKEKDNYYLENGIELVKREIVVPKSEVKATVIGTIDLPPYKGYNSRYILVKDTLNHRVVKHLDSSNFLAKMLNRSFFVAIGFMKPVVWVPATLLGISIESLFSPNTYGDSLTTQIQEEEYSKIFQLEDKLDKLPNQNFIPLATTNMANGKVFCRVLTKDKNSRPIDKSGMKTFDSYAPNYKNNSFFQEKMYNSYINNVGGEYSESRPFPEVNVK